MMLPGIECGNAEQLLTALGITEAARPGSQHLDPKLSKLRLGLWRYVRM